MFPLEREERWCSQLGELSRQEAERSCSNLEAVSGEAAYTFTRRSGVMDAGRLYGQIRALRALGDVWLAVHLATRAHRVVPSTGETVS